MTASTETTSSQTSVSFATLGACLIGSLMAAVVCTTLYHLVASGWLNPLGRFLESLLDGFLAHAWVSVPVVISLVFSLLFAVIEEESETAPVTPFFQRFLSFAPRVTALILVITVVLYSFTAGWWSPIFIAGTLAVQTHPEAFAFLALVMVLTSLCVWVKTDSSVAILLFSGLFSVSVILLVAAHDAKVVPMKTLVARAQNAWNAVPVEDQATPEKHLAAARAILYRDRAIDLTLTPQGLAITLLHGYLACHRRMEEIASDADPYTVLTVNGTPVVAGQDPCTALLKNAIVVQIAER